MDPIITITNVVTVYNQRAKTYIFSVNRTIDTDPLFGIAFV